MFAIELNNLENRIYNSIKENVATKGIKSKFSNLTVVNIENEWGLDIILDNGLELAEIGEGILIDSEGFQHNPYVLTLNQLTDIADFLINY